MSDMMLPVFLMVATLGSALMAGVFFAFSTFIMQSLSQISQHHGVAAMQSINLTILGSPFMPVFFGSALIALIAIGTGFFRWEEPGAIPMLAAGIFYFLGTFIVTVVFNVPLNNELAAVAPESAEATLAWQHYLDKWVLWNHVRTAASLIACGLYVIAYM